MSFIVTVVKGEVRFERHVQRLYGRSMVRGQADLYRQSTVKFRYH